ncbi:unnamed protein product [Natator depressus]
MPILCRFLGQVSLLVPFLCSSLTLFLLLCLSVFCSPLSLSHAPTSCNQSALKAGCSHLPGSKETKCTHSEARSREERKREVQKRVSVTPSLKTVGHAEASFETWQYPPFFSSFCVLLHAISVQARNEGPLTWLPSS